MVRPHVALAAGRRQARDLDRSGVARVAGGAGAERTIGIGLADAVATDAPALGGWPAFERDERIGRPLATAGVELFREGHLLRREVFVTVDGGPRRGGVPAAGKLLVDASGGTTCNSRLSDARRSMKPWWSLLLCPWAGWWHSRQLTFLRAWALSSYSWTTEYCRFWWHSAHLPDARMRSALGCSVTTRGRYQLSMNAPTRRAVPITTPRNTARNDMATPWHLRSR